MRLAIAASAFLFFSGLSAPVRAKDAAPARDLGLPFFETFDPQDYHGHTQVWSAAEDAAGLTYFGNFGCVLVYDGAGWDRIEVPGTSFVRGVVIDAQDTLWIGGVNELGYAKNDATGRRTFVSLREQLPAEARHFGELWRVALTPRGVLFQSNSWIFRWDGTRFAVVALPGGSGWQLIIAGNTVWITQNQTGWFTLKNDDAALALVPQERPAPYDRNALMFATPGDRPGEFIFGTHRQGLVRWDGREFTPFATEIDDVLRQKAIYRGIRLADGRFVLVVRQSGAFLLDAQGRLLAHLDESAGLPGNDAINVFEAASGAVWLTQQRGMARLDARPWLTWFGPARGAPRSNLRPPVNFRGELYTTSDDGLLRLAPGADGKPAQLVPVPEVTQFLEGIEVAGDRLIGYGDTLFEWRGPGTATVPLPGNPINVFDFTPAQSQPGRWFVLRDGGLHTYRREQEKWIAEAAIPELGHVRSVVELADGSWWMGTPSAGVLHVTFPAPTATGPGQPEIVRFDAGNGGLPTGHGWARVSLQNGRPLLRCERGLFRLAPDGTRWVPTEEFGARFADGTTTARTMADSPRDGLWMAARPAGQAELVTNLELGVFGRSGWQPLHLPQLARLDDVSGIAYDEPTDVLWLAGHSGLVRLDLARWRAGPPSPSPRVLLRSAETSGRRLSSAGHWQLPYARRALRIQFAAPALTGDPAAVYESTLLGSGEPVVLTDATPQREFSALARGHYRLRLRAHDGSGRWSEPLELAFTVLPPWWFSGWAWATYVVASLGLIALFISSRTRVLHRRAAQLEATVAARTEELRRSNLELVRLNQLELDEKIAARLAEEKARLEVLRYQLNPHFLFNALTSVCSQLPPSLGGARAILERLTDFCQLTLFQPAGGESPTLGQEMKMLTAYLDIEQTRWGELLEVSVEVDPAAEAAKVPSLLLLPLVENALKYGQATTRDKLRLRLAARREPGGALLIEIANTGQWVAPAERGIVPSLGIGHENLRQRLQRYYPGAHEFVTAAVDGWVTVRLRLRAPLKE